MSDDTRDILKIVLLAFILTAAVFLPQAKIGFNIADEGFLWYGAWQTSLGAAPILDFHSYDPGRYYWAALWSPLLGTGIVAVRISSAIFLAIGLSFGLLAARRCISSFRMLALLGLFMALCFHPWFKFAEPAIAMAAVFFGVRLIERPSFWRYFTSGVFVGLAAFFGKNHGLYTLAAFCLLMLLIRMRMDGKDLFKCSLVFSGGVIVGFSPILFMAAFIPGFAGAYVNSILLIASHGTQLPLPTPWPWNIDYASISLSKAIRKTSLGAMFAVMAAFYAIALAAAAFGSKKELPKRALLAASAAVGVFYAHHAFSRPEVNHFTQSMHPLILGFAAVPASFAVGRKAIAAVAALLLLLSIEALIKSNKAFDVKKAFNGSYVKHQVGRDSLWIRPDDASFIDAVKRTMETNSAPGDSILFAPNIPTLYAAFEKKSPIKDTYILFPDSEERQAGFIRDIEAAGTSLAFVSNAPLDGREELRFGNSHALMWSHLLSKFDIIDAPSMPQDYVVFKRKVAAGR